MFENHLPAEYGIIGLISLVTDSTTSAKYRAIKRMFAAKSIAFDTVLLDSYSAYQFLQENKDATYPFIVVSDGLIRDVFDYEESISWINSQETGKPMYNGYDLYKQEATNPIKTYVPERSRNIDCSTPTLNPYITENPTTNVNPWSAEEDIPF